MVTSNDFNRSALDDIESQLITYFNADDATKKKVSYDEKNVINRTAGNTVNDYKERDIIAFDVIIPLWEKEFFPRGWVKTPTMEELRTKALVRYSPIKILSPEQANWIDDILKHHDTNYVINGDAGTGKTVLLTHLVASILNNTDYTIGVVVQPNWEKTGNEIFKIFGMNSERLSVTTSTKMIMDYVQIGLTPYDVIIVDESHKLSRQYGKQHPSFDKVYQFPQFSSCKSHLEILQKIGHQKILMYDA